MIHGDYLITIQEFKLSETSPFQIDVRVKCKVLIKTFLTSLFAFYLLQYEEIDYKTVIYFFQMHDAIIPATDSRSIFSVIFLVLIDSSIELEIRTYAESAVAGFQPFLDIQ